MLPHVHVHRRSHKNWRAGGEIHGRQEIVGDALREFCQDIGGRRSHDQRLGPLRLADVFDGGFVAVLVGIGFIPEAGDHFVAGECGESERLHKARCRLRHHHVHFHAAPLQRAHQFRRFVRRNAAGNADRYSHIYDCSPT